MKNKEAKLDLKALRILQGFARVLGHKIRTPLSVIQNDLSYFQAFLPDNECKRSLEKCAVICDLLKEACPGNVEDLISEDLDLAALLCSFQESFSFLLLDDRRKIQASLVANAELLHLAFRSLFSILKRIIPEGTGCSVVIDDREDIESLQISVSFPLRPESEIEASSSSSLSDFFCLKAGCDFLEAPLCDALFWSHGFSEEVSLNKGSIPFIEILLRKAKE